MVRWYNPRLLMQIGARAAAATIIGQYADNRPVQAALDPVGDDPLAGAHDYSKADGEDFWFDYVADLGDGWNATYAVAETLSRPELSLDGVTTRRGRLLIMGGDEVYPAPSRIEYGRRTIDPYETAFPENDDGDPPHLFALPGNHDWYDGLHTFTNIFCQARRGANARPGRRFGGWQTRQTRSYFALKLPHGWWLCGFDVQLGAYIDAAQQDYFAAIAASAMKPGDKIVLCAAVPSWVLENVRDQDATNNLRFIKTVLTRHGAEIAVVLAGDLHHYARYEETTGAGPTLITSGGGGAFLHPTHKLPDQVAVKWDRDDQQTFERKQNYPSKARSFQLSWRNFLFPFINWDFALMMGAFYTLLAWFLETRSLDGGEDLRDAFLGIIGHHVSITEFWAALGDATWRFASAVPKSPEFAIVVLAGLAAFIQFNLTRNAWVRYGLGFVHWLAHMAALLITYCVAVQMTAWVEPHIDTKSLVFAIWLLQMIVFGGLLGAVTFGTYLFVALNLFGLQWTNSFSSLRIEDYKNFLRLRISGDGTLSIFPVKIEDVPRWPGGKRIPQSATAAPIEPAITIAGKTRKASRGAKKKA